MQELMKLLKEPGLGEVERANLTKERTQLSLYHDEEYFSKDIRNSAGKH